MNGSTIHSSELRLPAARHLYKPPHSAYCPRKQGLQVQCLQFTLQPSKCSPYSLFRSLSKAHCKRGEKLSLCGQAQGHPLPKVVTKPPNLEQLPSKPWVIVSGLALETPRKGYPSVLPGEADTHSSHFPPITGPGAPFQNPRQITAARLLSVS